MKYHDISISMMNTVASDSDFSGLGRIAALAHVPVPSIIESAMSNIAKNRPIYRPIYRPAMGFATNAELRV